MTPASGRGSPRGTTAEIDTEPATKRVLNAGSGPRLARPLHRVFDKQLWKEVRLDIDPAAEPDLLGSITDMRELAQSQGFDAIWSSHSLEHLHAHEVSAALSEFRRILKPDGFALITSPDLETAAAWLLEHGIDSVVYQSPAGPITARDILFGHSTSIAAGMRFMGHHTGFTCASLGQLLLDAGFPTVLAKRERVDLWALALMERADTTELQRLLKTAGLDMFDAPE